MSLQSIYNHCALPNIIAHANKKNQEAAAFRDKDHLQ